MVVLGSRLFGHLCSQFFCLVYSVNQVRDVCVIHGGRTARTIGALQV